MFVSWLALSVAKFHHSYTSLYFRPHSFTDRSVKLGGSSRTHGVVSPSLFCAKPWLRYFDAVLLYFLERHRHQSERVEVGGKQIVLGLSLSRWFASTVTRSEMGT